MMTASLFGTIVFICAACVALVKIIWWLLDQMRP